LPEREFQRVRHLRDSIFHDYEDDEDGTTFDFDALARVSQSIAESSSTSSMSSLSFPLIEWSSNIVLSEDSFGISNRNCYEVSTSSLNLDASSSNAVAEDLSLSVISSHSPMHHDHHDQYSTSKSNAHTFLDRFFLTTSESSLDAPPTSNYSNNNRKREHCHNLSEWTPSNRRRLVRSIALESSLALLVDSSDEDSSSTFASSPARR
jgi:hypothetical protein